MAVRARKLPTWVRREVSKFVVESCSNGRLLVTPSYVRAEADLDGSILPPGLLTRSALAAAVERVLNRCLGVEP